jgi:hypothetical protein
MNGLVLVVLNLPYELVIMVLCFDKKCIMFKIESKLFWYTLHNVISKVNNVSFAC